MHPILTITGVSKNYGKLTALDAVSFEVPAGAVFGILGPNGSGKTTLLSIILDVLHADTGKFSWFGNSPQTNNRKQIGSLLETPNFYHYLSAVDNLKITQAISGRGGSTDIEEVLRIVKLDDRKNSKFSSYSLGMKQRLAIGAALLGNPGVLVFDEPTNGLDPVKTLAASGKTIIMASHLLDEVEKVCTHVAILKKGNLLTAGPVDEVLAQEDIVEIAAANNDVLESTVQDMGGFTKIKKHDNCLQLFYPVGTAQLDGINKYCFDKGITLQQLQLKKKSLETKFFELTND
jgi:ABC-2 type transport system ATP-binding protein